MKKYNCPNCKKSYISKEALYDHLEKVHSSELGDMSPAHYFFNMRNNKLSGSCVVCGKPTKFNEQTEKYMRLCSKRCEEKYRKEFVKRMQARYGKNHLLNSPEQQKKMLQNRKISGTYTWKSGYKHKYTGSYEKNFLEFLEHFMAWEHPEDILSPAPDVFYYKFENKEHFYMPDLYISSLDLYIEIKGTSNKHYRLRDLPQEEAKDSSMSGKNYMKIGENDFQLFIDYLIKLKKEQ